MKFLSGCSRPIQWLLWNCASIHISLFSLNFTIGDSLIIITLIPLCSRFSRWKRVQDVIHHDWSPWFPSQRMFDQPLSYFTAKYSTYVQILWFSVHVCNFVLFRLIIQLLHIQKYMVSINVHYLKIPFKF